ncbi:MAG: GTP pyrophosphokinase family protein [Lachnospiraceae bacterium]|nr:GTP pyrophosphokinase family protein [Lachnospiraceae bacterium]
MESIKRKQKEFDIDEFLKLEPPEAVLESAQAYLKMMMCYRCAIKEVETKLQVLNEEFSLQYNRNPFESIKSRVKSSYSILEKLKRKGYEISVKNIEESLDDVAGIRVVCSFIEDIYHIEKMLAKQDDIIVLERKDYIENPKPNGYRSLHLILDIPIFLSDEKKHMKVEVQFRTIAMDFWASLEHKMKYKKDIEDAGEIAEELRICAESISEIDNKMQEIRNRIEKGKNPGK